MAELRFKQITDKLNASCYTCLRNYYNQKYHDRLSRGKAIRYLQSVFEG